MALETIANAVRSRFNTLITVGEGLATAWDNVPFEPTFGVPWVMAAVRTGTKFQADMGGGTTNDRWRQPGVLMVSIFVPIGAGSQPALEIADTVEQAFRAVTADGVTYRTPTPEVVGRVRDDSNMSWWQVNVSCPWYADTFA